ncbi:MAG TPA: HEAT repeat domain-containing protein [Chloroflexia bacterium]|nr:HEAT repeat domain-containing protein [Chloroflexia bacterium]
MEDIETYIEQLDNKDDKIRQHAFYSLKKSKDSEKFEKFKKILTNNSSSQKRASAALLLGEWKNSISINILLSSLSDTDLEVRRAVVKSLATSGSNEIEETLIELLKDQDWLIRNLALSGLQKIGSKEFLPKALEFLNDSQIEVRKCASILLGWSQSSEAAIALSKLLLTDKSSEVREATAKSLGQIKNVDSLSSLLLALNDPDTSVKNSAIVSLGYIGSPEIIPVLEEKAKTDSSETNWGWKTKDAANSAIKYIKKRYS